MINYRSHFGISYLDTKLILTLKLTWFRLNNTSHLMTFILQYITLTTRYLLVLALNVITVIFIFVGCTHFLLIKNRSPTY